MTNREIADTLEMLADLLEFQGANPFRIRSYRNGARTIRDLTDSIATIVQEDASRLKKLPGIGESVAEKCVTLVQTGSLPQLQELLEKIPESVLSLLRLPGLGPKKAAALYRELGIESLPALEAACRAGKVRELKGFGEKTEQSILDHMRLAATADQRIYWANADEIARQLREHLATVPGIQQLELAGSYRRGRETVGDLDILACAADPQAVMDRLAELPEVEEVLGRGDTKMSVRVSSGLQMDLRVVPAESFGAALQYFTGSKEHNVELRSRAKQSGLKINEYGVYRVAGDADVGDSGDNSGGDSGDNSGGVSGDEPAGVSGDEYVRVSGDEYVRVAGATEEEVYAALGLPWFPPELREGRQEFQWAEAGELPELLELSDIRGDLHMHTQATDGKATLDDMVETAIQRGLEYIAITDHSQRVTMARGLNAAKLRSQWKRIDEVRQRVGEAIHVLKGIECDILEAGGMDLPDDVLAEADWVLASVHYGQKQSRAQITERILGAIEHPSVHAVAHPTGRILNRREPYEVDLEAVFQAAKRHGKLLELNANPMRLDLHDVHCAMAKKLGILIVINSDAHSTQQFNVMRYGVLQARRAGLTRHDVVNTRPWPEFKKYLDSARAAR
jgi:DNA polymerase (family X)